MIERVEKFLTRNFVSPLASSETSFVNAVVNVVVDEIGKLPMFGFDIFREKIDILVGCELVEHGVEHRADVVLAIVHDLFRFFVPKHRHRHAFLEVRIGGLVSLT